MGPNLLLRRRAMMGAGGKDYSKIPLGFKAINATTISWVLADESFTGKTIEVSADGGNTWESKTSTRAGTTLATLSPGQSIMVRGNNDTYGGSGLTHYNYFLPTDDCLVYGNIMSLTDGEDFSEAIALRSQYTFKRLFGGDSPSRHFMIDNVVLPATTLTSSCYNKLFSYCTVVDAPKLPALVMADNCYREMFSNCASLTKAPELPALTLAQYCYYGMFESTHITEAPDLPAENPEGSCYQAMFRYCQYLQTPPQMSLSTLGKYNVCTEMFNGCKALTKSPVLLPQYGAASSGSYQKMFYECSSLSDVRCMLSSQFAICNNWLSGVSANGTFTKSAGSSWPTGASGIPSGWTVIEV